MIRERSSSANEKAAAPEGVAIRLHEDVLARMRKTFAEISRPVELPAEASSFTSSSSQAPRAPSMTRLADRTYLPMMWNNILHHRLIPIDNPMSILSDLIYSRLDAGDLLQDARYRIFKARLGDRDVIVKFAATEEAKSALRHEHLIYKHLSKLQGSVIPHSYGCFAPSPPAFCVHLLEDCGTHINSFERLHRSQRWSLFQGLRRIHTESVLHNNCREPGNVVVSSEGSAKFIGFSGATIFTAHDGKPYDEILGLLDDVALSLDSSGMTLRNRTG